MAVREARAEVGSPWAALWTTFLIAVIPIAAVSGFHWNPETKIAVFAAAISYPIWFLVTVVRKGWELHRHGHPHFFTEIDLGEEGLSIWLMLRDGSAPQAVNRLGLCVRRR